MPENFTREVRYIVVKRKRLTAEQETALLALLDSFQLPQLNCAVVEADWPEYEVVWNLIERRVAGAEGAVAFLPGELDAELATILGRPNFSFIQLAQIFRAAGVAIPMKAEAEQAFFIHRFLLHWARHGTAWSDAADADIRLHLEEARARAADNNVEAR